MKYIKQFCVFLLIFFSLFFVVSSSVGAQELSVPKIDSPSAILMDMRTGKILYEKDMNKKMYPASLTKVLTAILVLENCNLNDVATVSENAVTSISFGYVTANLQIGENLTVKDLLYVLMVGSSNDAAIVLAEHVSGSVEAFAKLMNDKAKELGCTSSNFVNPNGAHDENHYSSAYDLALITQYAMKNETFRTLASTTSYKLPATNKYKKDDRIFTTTNSLLVKSNSYYYKYATGVKTGFTTPAGNCLIASANKDDLELLTVVLNAGLTGQGLSVRYLDTTNLFKYGYDNYTVKDLINEGSVVQTVNIKNATRDTKKLDGVVSKDISVLIQNSNENNSFLPEVVLNEDLKAPIKKGDVIGTVKYSVEGVDYTADLLANNDVKKSRFLINSLLIILVIVLAYLYIKMNNKKKRNRRLKHRLKR